MVKICSLTDSGGVTTTQELFTDIGDYVNWREVEEIEKGWSGDKKYHVRRNNGAELLLRVSDISKYKKMRETALFSCQIHDALELNMNVPIEVGACSGDRLSYAIYTWVDGVDAGEKIKNMHIPVQVQYGEKAGRMLAKIHSVKAPDDILPWEQYYNSILDKYIMVFSKLNITFRGVDKVLGYIENNRHLLKDRPQTALHGDFHAGNLVIDRKGEIGIIDFDRWCWGDPYMDFHCIRFSDNIAFARGQVNGYFNGGVSGNFFALLGLYTAADILCSICSAYPFGRKELDKAVAAAEKLVREYNNFEGLVPTWY